MKNLPTLEQFKDEAKKLKESYGVKSSHAHEILARSYGFNSYNGYRAFIKK